MISDPLVLISIIVFFSYLVIVICWKKSMTKERFRDDDYE